MSFSESFGAIFIAMVNIYPIIYRSLLLQNCNAGHDVYSFVSRLMVFDITIWPGFIYLGTPPVVARAISCVCFAEPVGNVLRSQLSLACCSQKLIFSATNYRLSSILPCSRPHVGAAQNSRARVTQVLVVGSIYQVSFLVAMLPGNRILDSLSKSDGGGVLDLLFTQKLIPQIFVGFSVACHTQALEESAACCLGTA